MKQVQITAIELAEGESVVIKAGERNAIVTHVKPSAAGKQSWLKISGGLGDTIVPKAGGARASE